MRARSYNDELGREKRVDRSALQVIAKWSEEHERELFVLDPKNRTAERIGKRSKPSS